MIVLILFPFATWTRYWSRCHWRVSSMEARRSAADTRGTALHWAGAAAAGLLTEVAFPDPPTGVARLARGTGERRTSTPGRARVGGADDYARLVSSHHEKFWWKVGIPLTVFVTWIWPDPPGVFQRRVRKPAPAHHYQPGTCVMKASRPACTASFSPPQLLATSPSGRVSIGRRL